MLSLMNLAETTKDCEDMVFRFFYPLHAQDVEEHVSVIATQRAVTRSK